MTLGALQMFVNSYELNISKHNVQEVFRKMVIRGGKDINYDKFKEALAEMFFIKQASEEFQKKQMDL